MKWKNGSLYDGYNRIDFREVFGKIEILYNGSKQLAPIVERFIVKELKKNVVITDDVFITVYKDKAYLVVNGKIKPVNSTMAKYMPEENELKPLK